MIATRSKAAGVVSRKRSGENLDLSEVEVEPIHPLIAMGFIRDITLLEEYGSDCRVDLWMRYSELGSAQVIGRNPLIDSAERCYFVGTIAGSDAEEAHANQINFQRIGQFGTTYYSLNEILEFLRHPEVPWHSHESQP